MRKNPHGFSDEAITAFTEGDCWALALSINKRTGWPIIFLCDESFLDGDEVPEDYWMHVLVKHPSGKWLDVHGLNTPKQMRKYWCTGTWVEANREEAIPIIGWSSDPDGLNFPDYSADEYADKILERINFS